MPYFGVHLLRMAGLIPEFSRISDQMYSVWIGSDSDIHCTADRHMRTMWPLNRAMAVLIVLSFAVSSMCRWASLPQPNTMHKKNWHAVVSCVCVKGLSNAQSCMGSHKEEKEICSRPGYSPDAKVCGSGTQGRAKRRNRKRRKGTGTLKDQINVASWQPASCFQHWSRRQT